MLRIRITEPGQKEHERISKLLPTIFPKEELVPKGITVKPLPYLCFYDDDTFIGFAEVFKSAELHYLKYMAILPEYRSKGYGGKMLSLILSERGSLPLALDVEPTDENAANAEQRRRRLQFYLRHGMIDTGYDFVFGGNRYFIMSTGEENVPELMQKYCEKDRTFKPGYIQIRKRGE